MSCRCEVSNNKHLRKEKWSLLGTVYVKSISFSCLSSLHVGFFGVSNNNLFARRNGRSQPRFISLRQIRPQTKQMLPHAAAVSSRLGDHSHFCAPALSLPARLARDAPELREQAVTATRDPIMAQSGVLTTHFEFPPLPGAPAGDSYRKATRSRPDCPGVCQPYAPPTSACSVLHALSFALYPRLNPPLYIPISSDFACLPHSGSSTLTHHNPSQPQQSPLNSDSPDFVSRRMNRMHRQRHGRDPCRGSSLAQRRAAASFQGPDSR